MLRCPKKLHIVTPIVKDENYKWFENNSFIVGDFEDKSTDKRKETAKEWAKRPYSEIKSEELDNTFNSGFKISGYDSRYSTQNKVIDMIDSFGHGFELYMESFIDLVKNTTIIKGEIQEKLCFTFNEKGQIHLLKEGDERLSIAQKGLELFHPEVGGYAQRKNGDIIKYIGTGKIRIFGDVVIKERYTNLKVVKTFKIDEIINTKNHIYLEELNWCDGQYLVQKSKAILYKINNEIFDLFTGNNCSCYLLFDLISMKKDIEDFASEYNKKSVHYYDKVDRDVRLNAEYIGD